MAQILYYITAIESILLQLGYSLDPDQPHLSEEGLINMRDKKVLVGRRLSDGARAIIKSSNLAGGKQEIASEKAIQDALSRAVFSRERILFPKELFYGDKDGFLIRVTQFIEQEKVFASYPVEEQFFKIIKEFETQEGFYANTFEHLNMIKSVFPITRAEDYVEQFKRFEIEKGKAEALKLLEDNERLIDERCNYLTHTDFVPSNFRVSVGRIYMIDLSSMHFANRYEGLARLTNWCIVHDPKLGEMITKYIKDNRGLEEYLCLRLMRIYKAGFLVDHYARTLKQTQGDLRRLTEERLALWQEILSLLILDEPISPSLINAYKTERDRLRTPKEMERQRQFNLT